MKGKRVAEHGRLHGRGKLDLAHDRPMLSSTYAGVRSALSMVADPGPRPRSQVISSSWPASTRLERLLVVVDGDAVSADRHVAVGDRDPIGIERCAGRAELAHDPAPVGVLPVPGALDELALGDTPGGPACRFAVGGSDDPDPDHLGPALGIGDHLRGEIGTRRCERLGQRLPAPPRPEPARHHDHRVVRRHAAVDGHLVERVPHRGRTEPPAGLRATTRRRS